MEIGLLTTEQLMHASLWKRSAHKVRQQWSNLNDTEFRRAVIHDLIETQVSDVLQTTVQRLECEERQQTADGRRQQMIMPSIEIAEQKREMEQFLMEHVYRHPNVMVCRRRVADWIETIFDYYATQPERLPERYGTIIQQEGAQRAAADYVADQTDRSVRSELLKLNPRRAV
jgi:dGTPase